MLQFYRPIRNLKVLDICDIDQYRQVSRVSSICFAVSPLFNQQTLPIALFTPNFLSNFFLTSLLFLAQDLSWNLYFHKISKKFPRTFSIIRIIYQLSLRLSRAAAHTSRTGVRYRSNLFAISPRIPRSRGRFASEDSRVILRPGRNFPSGAARWKRSHTVTSNDLACPILVPIDRFFRDLPPVVRVFAIGRSKRAKSTSSGSRSSPSR